MEDTIELFVIDTSVGQSISFLFNIDEFNEVLKFIKLLEQKNPILEYKIVKNF